MAARFAFSALFSAVGIAAAFDDAITADAGAGRVNRAFAMLASTEYGLPLIKGDGNPINKPAFLKLADAYRAANGKGHGIKGHNNLRAWGEALDAIALHLRAGATPTPEQVQAYAEAGQYRDGAAWALAVPAPKKAEKKAEKKAAPAAVAAPAAPVAPAPDMVAPLPVITGSADPLPEAGDDAGADAGAGDSVEVGADVLFDAVMLGLQTGAFSGAELLQLARAVGEALTAAADVADEAGAVAHSLLVAVAGAESTPQGAATH